MARMDYAKRRRTEQARDAIRDLKQTERIEREIKIKSFPLLSADEIRRRLAWIKASDRTERYARRHAGFNTISVLTGYGRDYLYKLANGQLQPTARSQQRISAALQQIDLPNLYQQN